MTTGNSTRREWGRPALDMEFDTNIVTLPPTLSKPSMDMVTHTSQKNIPLYSAVFSVSLTPRGAREERTLVTSGWEILLWSTSIYPKSQLVRVL